ncbi:extracellular solute-binding protein [bacterium]|nr:MAG: extracellular solute-binding protein [bacterium]
MNVKTALKTGFAAILAAVAVAVLAPPPPPVQHWPNREKVVFWHMWTGEWQPVVEGIAKRFNESQDQYEVVPLSIPADGAETKFMLSASGGATPDLVSQWNPILGTWTDRGLIRPIEEIMSPAERTSYLREAYPIMREHATYRDRVTAMIAGIDVYALYYRLDHLREVGRDANSLPKTLEELEALGRQLDKRNGDGRLTRIGYLPQSWKSYVPSFGGGFGTGDRMTFDTPPNLRAVEFITGVQEKLGFDSIRRFLASQAADTGATAPLIAGNYSIMLDGQWRVKQTAQYGPEVDYIVAPLPAPKGGLPNASTTDANYMVVPRAAKNPKGAWAFLKYWLGVDDPEAGGRNTADMGWLPYCDRVARSKAYQEYLEKFPRFRPFVDLVSSPNLSRFPAGPLQSYAVGEVTKADEATSRGTLTPAAALRGIDDAVAAEKARQRRLGNVR